MVEAVILEDVVVVVMVVTKTAEVMGKLGHYITTW